MLFIDEDLREEVKIMVGGAPVTQTFADDMGADGVWQRCTRVRRTRQAIS